MSPDDYICRRFIFSQLIQYGCPADQISRDVSEIRNCVSRFLPVTHGDDGCVRRTEPITNRIPWPTWSATIWFRLGAHPALSKETRPRSGYTMFLQYTAISKACLPWALTQSVSSQCILQYSHSGWRFTRWNQDLNFAWGWHSTKQSNLLPVPWPQYT